MTGNRVGRWAVLAMGLVAAGQGWAEEAAGAKQEQPADAPALEVGVRPAWWTEVPAPEAELVSYRNKARNVALTHPRNWEVREERGEGVLRLLVGPPQAHDPDGRRTHALELWFLEKEATHGLQVSVAEIAERLAKDSGYLEVRYNLERDSTIAGKPSRELTLNGRKPGTLYLEWVTVAVRTLENDDTYRQLAVVTVTPRLDSRVYAPLFNKILEGLKVR